MRRELFRNPRWAELFMKILQTYRPEKFLLHEFVLMTDHFHLIITPKESLEKAVQFIKGGFSFRVKKDLGSSMEVWQGGFSDQRIRDTEDYQIHVAYICGNRVRKKYCSRIEEYPYSSRASGIEVDDVPQRLKPLVVGEFSGTPEGVPFQGNSKDNSQGKSNSKSKSNSRGKSKGHS